MKATLGGCVVVLRIFPELISNSKKRIYLLFNDELEGIDENSIKNVTQASQWNSINIDFLCTYYIFNITFIWTMWNAILMEVGRYICTEAILTNTPEFHRYRSMLCIFLNTVKVGEIKNESKKKNKKKSNIRNPFSFYIEDAFSLWNSFVDVH